MDVRLTTLGIPSVAVKGEELGSLPGKPVSFGLLVFLALEGEATRDRLVSFFWPEATQERARHTLSRTLSELRQEVGEGWVECRGKLVRTTGNLWVDVREFEGLVDTGRHREAVALYGGAFLEGVHLARTPVFEEWVERQRARLARRHREALEALIAGARARGELKEAVKGAWRWVALDPLDDCGQHCLIRLLAESGSRSEALAQYERYAALLEKELGLEPLDETRELMEGIRAGAVAPPLVRGVEPGEAEPPPSPYAWPPPLPSVGQAFPASGPSPDRTALRGLVERELAGSLQILRPLGRGTMSDVFLAREPHLKRLVAVKVLSVSLSSDPRARKRFEREAQAAARLNHPHVCTVYRVGSLSDGTPYLVLPFVKGTSLAHRLKAEGRLPPLEAGRVMREVASALAAAHKLGIIHRDVRPDNVLHEEDTGRHFLCDFGIAGILDMAEEVGPRLTRTGEVLGHPAYMSPEQMAGAPLTDRTDIYSLGVLAHELLTGHPPPPPQAGGRRRKSGEAGPELEGAASLLERSDPGLLDLLRRCLETDPHHRPGAADIVRRLEDGHGATRPWAAPSGGSSLFWGLWERRFFHIVGAYTAAAWIAVEAAGQLEDKELLPEPAFLLTLTTAIAGLVAAGVLAWFHGKKGRQAMTTPEKWILAFLAAGWAVACGFVLS